MNVLIVVTHLLGTGHLARALTLGRAFADAGHRVRIASGGFAAPQLDPGDLDLVQLPPLRSDGTTFTALLDETGAPAETRYLEARRRALLQTLTPAPDILITELFPFGRRVLRGEFLALLDAARALPRRPLVLGSIRDILAPPSKPDRARQTEAWVRDLYDGVLVHSDPAITPLEASWPVTPALAPYLHYTGFVAPPAPIPTAEGRDEVLVSAGGGAVGRALFAAAAVAARGDTRRWRLLTTAPPTGLSPNVLAEPPRSDFRSMLTGCAASVSLCGYNTAMDILQSGCRAVLVPFDAGGETEQGIRAKSLSRQPGITVLNSADLSPATLCTALDAALSGADRAPRTGGLDGAKRAVQIAAELARGRRA